MARMKTDNFTRNLFKYVAASLLIPGFILFGILYMDEIQYTQYLGSSVFDRQLNAQVADVKNWVALKIGYLELSSEIFEKNLLSLEQKNQNQRQKEEEVIYSILSEIKTSSSEVINAYYSDEWGNNYVNGKRTPKVDGRKREWYKGAKIYGYYVSKPYKDVMTSKMVITFSHRIEDGKGYVRGVIGYDIVFEDLLEKLRKCVKNINGRIQLIEGADQEHLAQKLNPSLPENLFEMQGDRNFALDGRFYYLREIGVGRYRILFEINSGQFIDNYFSKGSDYQIRLALALLVIILLSGYVVSRFSRPIKSLTEKVHGFWGSGEAVETTQAIEADFEVVYDLFHQFNNHLISNIEALKEANQELLDQKERLSMQHEALATTTDELMLQNRVLKEKDELYTGVMENISDLIWTTDHVGKITFASRNLQELLGYEEQELLGQNVAMILPEVDDEFAGIYEMFRKRNFEGIELQLQHKDGQTAFMVNTRTTRILSGGQLLSIQAVARDITHEKKLFVDYFYKNRELFVINEVNRAMTSMGSDVAGILKSIADKVNTLMNVSFCTVRILKGDELVMTAFSGNTHSFIYKGNVKMEHSHMGMALEYNDIINLRSRADRLMEEPLVDQAFEEIGNLIFIPLRNNDKLFGVLSVGARNPLGEDKISMLRYLSQSASISIEKSTIYDRLRENYLKTIESLANALEEKLYNMHGHTIRVARYATTIASRMFLKESEVDEVNIAGLLHDIGKIGINDEILRSSAARATLDDDLLQIIACHPSIGKKILSPIGLSKQVIEGIYLHHKRYDLTGYPYEEDVSEQPLIAQIIQAADDFDNLIRGTYTERPMTIGGAVEKMKAGSGSLYGPEVIDILEELATSERDKLLAIEYT